MFDSDSDKSIARLLLKIEQFGMGGFDRVRASSIFEIMLFR